MTGRPADGSIFKLKIKMKNVKIGDSWFLELNWGILVITGRKLKAIGLFGLGGIFSIILSIDLTDNAISNII